MMDNGNVIVGADWLSRSRTTYVVRGDAKAVRRFLGETARVSGEIIDRGPFLKEIVVRGVQVSDTAERLSMRTGYIKELGPSIYMQGTHVLVDREGKLVCLLQARDGSLDLGEHMKTRVAVVGVMGKTVEGDAQIMDVRLVEPAK